MSKPALRICPTTSDDARGYRAERQQRELDRMAGVAQAKTVAVPLGKVVPLLLDAVSSDRAWLRDFAEDTVRIDADLYDVLLAYQQLRGRAAA